MSRTPKQRYCSRVAVQSFVLATRGSGCVVVGVEVVL